MPEPESKETPTAETKSAESHKETPPLPPAAVTLDANQLGSIIGDQVGKALERIGNKEAERVIDQPILPPSEAEWDAAADDPKAMRMLSQRQSDAATDRLRRQLTPQFDQGASTINELSLETIRGLKHFKRFETEIRKQIGTVPKGITITPSTVKRMYDFVIGQHFDELEKEVEEQSIRKGREEIPASQPGGASGRETQARAEDEKPETLFGEPAASALRSKRAMRQGRTLDEEARRMSGGRSKTWSEYAKKTKEIRARGEDDSLGLDQ